jgi:isoquinoline 1-oxidoreductase beta subunit
MEGGAGYALGAVLRNEITFTDGEVEQSNFTDYLPLRITDMPAVEVVIVTSAEAPSGVGEPAVPPTGPAVANAIFAVTGKRITQLPMSKYGFRFV